MARRMTAKQRRYFGKRRSTRRTTTRVRRAVRRGASKIRRSYRNRGSLLRGWLPLGNSEMITDLAVGAFNPLLQSTVAPYVDRWLPVPDNFKDEARTALVGTLLYKFAPGGFLKDYGKETFRLAVYSTGAELRGTLMGGTTVGTPGVVYY